MCERDYNTIIAVLYLSALRSSFFLKGSRFIFSSEFGKKNIKFTFEDDFLPTAE